MPYWERKICGLSLDEHEDNNFDKIDSDSCIVSFFKFLGVWLSSFNSTANPFVYALLMPTYRKCVMKTFCPCVDQGKQKRNQHGESKEDIPQTPLSLQVQPTLQILLQIRSWSPSDLKKISPVTKVLLNRFRLKYDGFVD